MLRTGDRPRPALPLVIAALTLAAAPCAAESFRVLPDESDLVVLTRKAGFAAGLAHDHAVAAAGYQARLTFAAEDPTAATFELEVPVENLKVDDPEVEARIGPRLVELGLRDAPFAVTPEADRPKIRAAMLGTSQLDAARFPTISASARVSGRRDAQAHAGSSFPFAVRLKLEIDGRAVVREAAARYDLRGDRLVVEATADFEFTEFGIRPYSAFLGAVKNRNAFRVYVRLTAVRD